jgi:hypothetical protein
MVSTVMLEPLMAASIPEGTKKAIPTIPTQQTNHDTYGELSTSVKYHARLESDRSPAGSDKVRQKGLGFNL